MQKAIGLFLAAGIIVTDALEVRANPEDALDESNLPWFTKKPVKDNIVKEQTQVAMPHIPDLKDMLMHPPPPDLKWLKELGQPKDYSTVDEAEDALDEETPKVVGGKTMTNWFDMLKNPKQSSPWPMMQGGGDSQGWPKMQGGGDSQGWPKMQGSPDKPQGGKQLFKNMKNLKDLFKGFTQGPDKELKEKMENKNTFENQIQGNQEPKSAAPPQNQEPDMHRELLDKVTTAKNQALSNGGTKQWWWDTTDLKNHPSGWGGWKEKDIKAQEAEEIEFAVDAIFKEYVKDVSRPDGLSKEETMDWLAASFGDFDKAAFAGHDMTDVFEQLDIDKSGFIEKDELGHFMKEVVMPVVKERAADVKANEDAWKADLENRERIRQQRLKDLGIERKQTEKQELKEDAKIEKKIKKHPELLGEVMMEKEKEKFELKKEEEWEKKEEEEDQNEEQEEDETTMWLGHKVQENPSLVRSSLSDEQMRQVETAVRAKLENEQLKESLHKMQIVSDEKAAKIAKDLRAGRAVERKRMEEA